MYWWSEYFDFRKYAPVLLVGWLAGLSVSTSAQSVAPWALGNGGGSFRNPNNETTTEWSIGQMAYSTLGGSGVSLTEGMLQPFFNSPLPVEWLAFHAKRESDHQVRLDWITGSEKNNSGFAIERKLEVETDFSRAGYVPAAFPSGASALPQAYLFFDLNPHPGRSYYRLVQTDFDGRQHLSPIRVVDGPTTSGILEQWPNPNNGSFFVKWQGDGPATGVLTDALGRTVQKITFSSGVPLSFDLKQPGIYFLRLETTAGSNRLKIVVQ